MRPVRTEKSNHDFGPPPGEGDRIGHLPCEIERTDDEGTWVYSVWEPTKEERKAIADGQNVQLGVAWIGAFPPVCLGVTRQLELVEDAVAHATS